MLPNRSLTLGDNEVLTRLFAEKGVFTKEGFLAMVKVVDREMKRIEK